MLPHVLNTEDYALCLTPGFFRFYAHVGILHALEECNLLKPKYVTGSSAGALVGAFLASGKKPSQMIEAIMPMERKDFWDMGGIGGLLKGRLFQEKIEQHLPVQNIEECPVAFACTAYDTVRFRTKKITSGSIATAARASCTFPGLFQPVIINGTPHIDGGVWDWTGLMALDECIISDAKRKYEKEASSHSPSIPNFDLETLFPKNNLIVNICYDTDFGSKLPENLSHARLLTIVVENIPPVTPFTMGKVGIEAYKFAKAAMHRALFSCHMQELCPNHWCCYVDGKLAQHIPAEIRNGLPSPQVSAKESFTPRRLSLPSISSSTNLSQRSSQQKLALPSAGTTTTATSRLQLSRATSIITNTSDHTLAETALFHVPLPDQEERTLDGSNEGNDAHSESSEEEESTLLPNMPGVNLLPSFHLPHMPEHLGDFVHLPSYHFINGTYFYEAFHHTAQNAADTLHHTLHAMNTTMTATLDTLLSNGRGTKRRREEDDQEEEDEQDDNETDESEIVDDKVQENNDLRPVKLHRLNEEELASRAAMVPAVDGANISPASQPEELLDYPPTQFTQTIDVPSSNQMDTRVDSSRNSEDLDDALAILDAVDFMVSSHNNHINAIHTNGSSASRPTSQLLGGSMGELDPIEMFAEAIDVEIAAADASSIST